MLHERSSAPPDTGAYTLFGPVDVPNPQWIGASAGPRPEDIPAYKGLAPWANAVRRCFTLNQIGFENLEVRVIRSIWH